MKKQINDTYKNDGGVLVHNIDRSSKRKKLFGGSVEKTVKGQTTTDFNNKTLDGNITKTKTVYNKAGDVKMKKSKAVPMSKIAKFI